MCHIAPEETILTVQGIGLHKAMVNVNGGMTVDGGIEKWEDDCSVQNDVIRGDWK